MKHNMFSSLKKEFQTLLSKEEEAKKASIFERS
jgi:hypothetical protein